MHVTLCQVAFALLRVANYSSTLTDDLSEATLVGMGVAAISVAEHVAATGLAAAAGGNSGVAVDGMCAAHSACGAAALGHLAQSQAPAARAACATLIASHGAMQALVQLLATLPPSTPHHRGDPLTNPPCRSLLAARVMSSVSLLHPNHLTPAPSPPPSQQLQSCRRIHSSLTCQALI